MRLLKAEVKHCDYATLIAPTTLSLTTATQQTVFGRIETVIVKFKPNQILKLSDQIRGNTLLLEKR